jgi:gas vesicle protein
METVDETRKPEEIERDIERTRSQMAGTLDEFQRQFSPGQLVDQALGYLEEKSGQFGSNLVNTVKENPIPATLVGVGLAWLITAGRNQSWEGGEETRYSGTMPPRRGRRTGGIRYGSRSQAAMGSRGYGEGYGPADYRMSGETGMGGSMGAGMGGSMEGQGRRMGEAMEETMEHAKGAMGQAAETVRQKASETAEHVRETYGEVREKASEMTEEARQRALELGHQVQDRARRVMQDEPLVVGALGLTIGAALGAMLPRTRQEDRLMGHTRDELLHQADETGGDMLREVREHVAAGMESAKSQGGTETSAGMPGTEPLAGMPPAGQSGPGVTTQGAGMETPPGVASGGSPGETGRHVSEPGWASPEREPGSKEPEQIG